MNLSIIIVNYYSDRLLGELLESIKLNKPALDYEIIVVNNGPFDMPEFADNKDENVIRIDNNDNAGFAKGCNIGIQRASGSYVLLLNPDTLVMDNCLDMCVQYMDKHSDIGALGCKVVLPGGKLDAACKRSFPTPFTAFTRIIGLAKLFPRSKYFGKYNLLYLDEDEIHEVDSLVGAFMLLRRSAIDQVGLLDERFFMYGEDIDLCYRIKNASWRILYYPKSCIMHHKGASGGKGNPKTIHAFYNSMLLFYNKHYRDKYPLPVTVLIYTAVYSILGFKLSICHLKMLCNGGRGNDKKSPEIF